MKLKKKSLLISLAAALLLVLSVFLAVYFGHHLPKERERAERESLVREYYAEKLTSYGEENARLAAYEVEVAFLGDSLTDGYPLAQYYPQYKTANRGIGGETSHGLQKRLGVSLYELEPKVAVLLIGGNNLDTVLENYGEMLAEIRATLPRTRLVVCSLTVMGKDLAEKNKTAAYNNAHIKRLAEQYGYSFVDLYTPMLDLETGELMAGYTTDGAHLTPLGYEALTSLITPAIEEELAAFR